MHAMNELEALRRKHQEIVNRCDLAVQEADYYRKQHKSVLNKCDQLVREAHALRGNAFPYSVSFILSLHLLCV